MRTVLLPLLILLAPLSHAAELPPSAYYRGELALPDGNRLPMELEFFLDAAGNPSGNMSSPAQGNRYVSVTSVALDDDTLAVTTAAPNARISGELSADGAWLAHFEQGEFRAELQLRPSAGMTEVERAQSVAALAAWPGAEISIPAAGASLAGTHVSPTQPKAAVLLLAGSGRAQRDGYHSGHRPLAVLGSALADAQIASLRYDKRGVYRSSGSLDVTDLDTIAADARAALGKLRELHPQLPLLVVGHSEGGLVAAMLAADQSLAGVVSLMGPTLPLIDLFALQDGTEAVAAGATADEAAALQAFTGRIYALAAQHADPEQRMAALGELMSAASDVERELFQRYNGGTGTLGAGMLRAPSYHRLLAVDPLHSWKATTAPGLLVFGEKDVQVPAEPNALPIANAATLKVVVLPRVNHMLQPTDDGSPSRYGAIEVTVDEELIAAVSDWIAFTANMR